MKQDEPVADVVGLSQNCMCEENDDFYANFSNHHQSSPSCTSSLPKPVCRRCLGLLTPSYVETVCARLVQAIRADCFEAESFKLSIELPACVAVRESVAPTQAAPRRCLKERLRLVISRLLEAATGWQWTVDGHLSVHCCFFNKEQDERLLEHVQRILGKRLSLSTRLQRLAVLETLDEKQRHELNANLLEDHIEEYCRFEQRFSSETLLLAGRYLKFSRWLYQTPWLDDEGRQVAPCIQELISREVLKRILCDEVKFSAGGREDADVRMLGNGRPFVLQCLNPRKRLAKDKRLLELQNAVNCSTKDIQIVDLHVSTQSEFGQLKAIETEKKKTYFALCRSDTEVEVEDLGRLNRLAPIEIQQKTPIRVLHRRTLATRSKCVHSMRLWPGRDRFEFCMLITTEAGTYIKEFVHGDFGRTVPNLSTLLEHPVDLVALDVQSIVLPVSEKSTSV